MLTQEEGKKKEDRDKCGWGHVMRWLDMEERGLKIWDSDREGGGGLEDRGSNRR